MEFNKREVETNLSKLLERVALGEEIVITDSGTPVAKLVPCHSQRGKRTLGMLRWEIWMADDFHGPLPDDILAGFLGEDPLKQKPVKPAGTNQEKGKERE